MRLNTVKTEDKELQNRLRQLAQEVISEISVPDPSNREEMLGAFVSELFQLAAEQKRRETRRLKQAEGIAAAKANGVHFGPLPRDLPDGFEELRKAWRNREITLRSAAERCGIPKSTFRDAALRVEMSASRAEAE